MVCVRRWWYSRSVYTDRAMPRLKRLSLKQRSFIRKYIQTGNATEAAFQSYSTKDRKTAQNIGSQNLDKPEIQDALEEALKKNNITLENVTSEVADLAFTKDVRPTVETKLRANVELLKLLKAYPEKINRSYSVSIKSQLASKDFKELLELHKQKTQELHDIINS